MADHTGTRRLLRHVTLAALTLPISFGLWQALGGAGAAAGSAEAMVVGLHDLAMGRSAYVLSDLALLERTLYFIDQRYVDEGRVDPERMFQAALEHLERRVPEVMLTREPGGRRLQVSVGAFESVLLVDPIQDLDGLHAQLRRVAAVVQEHISDQIERPELEYALVNGVLSTLDPHSVLLPPDAARDMNTDNQGEFGGLGIRIQVRDGTLTIDQPLEGTPAAKAGLRAGDQIVRIEGESTINMDLEDSVSRLRGEIGEPVTMSIRRRGVPEPFAVTIVRDRIPVNPPEGELLAGGVGYVRIKAFNRNVSAEVDDLLARLKREAPAGRLQGLVLDLRSNPGGYLQQAVALSDKFLDDGVIVATVEGAEQRRSEERATGSGTEPAYPIVVLVDGSSASASEIVAGALRNLGRAVIVGERTFGKGSVQHLYPNSQDESQLKLTVAKYLTPGDHSIQSVGIPPDVLLEPSIVRPGGEEGPLVSLYWRERLDREADLEHHLEADHLPEERPAYRLRYLRPEGDGEPERPGNADWEVAFARDLVAAAGPEAGRRATVLQAAAGLIAEREAAEDRRVAEAFAALGVDWSAGRNPPVPSVAIRVDLGEDGALVAGEAEEVKLKITNTGDAPLWRISATTSSEAPWLDGREFYVGRLEPGEERTVIQRVLVQEGASDELTQVKLEVRDPDHPSLTEVDLQVPVKGLPLPRFSYDLTLIDDGSGRSQGNGDGRPQVGETVELRIVVQNLGPGEARDAQARLRSRSGRALDLVQGRVPLGPIGDPACTGDCPRPMPAGAQGDGAFAFRLDALPPSGRWELELQLGDATRFDHTTVSRGGFHDYFQLEERIELVPDQPLRAGRRAPPQIQVTRSPGQRTAEAVPVLSGLVIDDEAVQDVIVYLNEDKIFYRGGGQGGRVPFSVDPRLEVGQNLLHVLVRDDRGLTSSWSEVVWRDPPEATAQVEPGP